MWRARLRATESLTLVTRQWSTGSCPGLSEQFPKGHGSFRFLGNAQGLPFGGHRQNRDTTTASRYSIRVNGLGFNVSPSAN